MKIIIGRKPFLKLIALSILGFWPIHIYYFLQKEIEFDKAKFTEEWIKIFVTSVIFVLFLKYFNLKHNKTIEEIKFQKDVLDLRNLLDKSLNIDIIDKIVNYCKILKSDIPEIKPIFSFLKKYKNNQISGLPITDADKERAKKEINNLKNLLSNETSN